MDVEQGIKVRERKKDIFNSSKPGRDIAPSRAYKTALYKAACGCGE